MPSIIIYIKVIGSNRQLEDQQVAPPKIFISGAKSNLTKAFVLLAPFLDEINTILFLNVLPSKYVNHIRFVIVLSRLQQFFGYFPQPFLQTLQKKKALGHLINNQRETRERLRALTTKK